ncbi:MAG: DNA polymerase III subunit alpha [Victivallaceae bacterium]|nr:DNA polymerase III subunit alpha [Victivallaceae bacterium]
MPSDFVHLHVHSHYSLLDGACTCSGLLSLAKEYEMEAVAITDHGYMGGCIDLYNTFRKDGIKPIFGCEMYVAPGSRHDRNQMVAHQRGFHLLVLAENDTGYHNLCHLISEAYATGMYYKPRIDRELLEKWHDGLMILSACIGGEVPARILAGDAAGAERAIDYFTGLVGKNNFFLELMDHGMDEEKRVNRELIKLSGKFGLKLVATNDVHYLKREHAEAHEVMLCIQTQCRIDDPKRFRFCAPEFYFKSPDEMKHIFREIPEAITNTRGIAERCSINLTFAPEANHYPVFTLSDNSDRQAEVLREHCQAGVAPRYGFDPTAGNLTPEQQALLDRMDYELSVITKTKYPSYFLVVADFINYAKTQDIPVGPGRGSGAGSVVAYLTGITDIDPIRYNLLFERFLNPERVSPPDFDVDFCEDRRVEVIDYVRNKYGADSVAQICTYGTLKPKAVIKDVARVLGFDFAFGDRITKLIPGDPKITIEKAIKASPDLKKMVEKDPDVARVFKHAEVLEGINRQLGIHAAGVIIGDQPLDNLVPLARGANGEVITEYPSVPCESLGLLKMDFLGLRTLTIIHNAVKMIERNRGVSLDFDRVPIDDKKTFDLLRAGDTVAVFQLESGGMQNLCRNFGVDTMEHIIALLAIYRPGPMDFIPQFVARKKGLEPVIYDHPLMEKYLQETYGIMLYQEQIMQVVQVLAGFSLGGADILRRAIGKKKVDVLQQQKEKFVDGCRKTNNIDAALAERIWEKIKMFAGYGFNKSHSAAYAFVAYRTAYLKANYPVEFMAAVLTSEIRDAEKIAFLISACKDMKIPVLPPDVNTSEIKFGVDGDSIRFGIGAIKGVGEAAAGAVLRARESGGKFTSFADFCERCGDAINSRMLENLIRAGAFDSFGLRRSQLMAVAEPTMRFAQSAARERKSGQRSLFELLDETEQDGIMNIPAPDIPEFDPEEILRSEKELLGFYVTGHPLTRYVDVIKELSTVRLNALEKLTDNTPVRFGGMVQSVTRKTSKKTQNPYLIVEIEGLDGTAECMMYERAMRNQEASGVQIEKGLPVFAEALASAREGETPRLSLEMVITLTAGMEKYAGEILLFADASALTDDVFERISQHNRRHRGETRLVFAVTGERDAGRIIYVETGVRVAATFEYLAGLEALFGSHCWKLKGNDKLPEPRRIFKPRPEQSDKAAKGN